MPPTFPTIRHCFSTPVYNDALARTARIATELARQYNSDLVDFHGAMTRMNERKQATDPALTIIGLDRTHPGKEGSKIMAELFLAAQGIASSVPGNPDQCARIWEHVSLERHLRNILWLEDRVLKPNHMDPADVEAARAFLTGEYKPRRADEIRIASYLEWKGRETELHRRLEEIHRQLVL